ncbi:hypothetical protein HID58_083610, partial [Brassica napus]
LKINGQDESKRKGCSDFFYQTYRALELAFNYSVAEYTAPMMCNVVKIVNQELGERSLEKPDLFLDSAPRLSHSWIQMAGK